MESYACSLSKQMMLTFALWVIQENVQSQFSLMELWEKNIVNRKSLEEELLCLGHQ